MGDPDRCGCRQVYQASVHGFLRLALGLSLLSSEPSEVAITTALSPHPATFRAVLDALEGFANLYDEREQARREFLALPSSAAGPSADRQAGGDPLADDEAEDVEMDETQVEGTPRQEEEEGLLGVDGARGRAQSGPEADRTAQMRAVVQRLRRRVLS